MLLTINLIVTTVYVSIEAPPKRGFSFMEIWIIGMQIPSIVAMVTSGYLILKMRNFESSKKLSMEYDEEEFFLKLKKCDMITCGLLTFYFISFLIIFYIVVMYQ